MLVDTDLFVQMESKAKHLLKFPIWDKGAVYLNVLGAMTFPDDQKKRLSWISRIQLEQKTRHRREKEECGQGKPYSDEEYAKDLMTLSKILGGPQNLNNILFGRQTNTTFEEFENSLHNGLFSGMILATATSHGVSPSRAFDILSDGEKSYALDIYNISKTIMKSNISRIWKRFHPVSHLWASWYIFLVEKDDSVDPSRDCVDQHFTSLRRRLMGKPDGLRGFLRLADGYLWKANKILVQTGRKKQKEPLLKFEDCFVVAHPYHEIRLV